MESQIITEIRRMDAEFQRFVGKEAFGYLAKPTVTSSRWTFQDGTVATSGEEALSYMTKLLYLAKADPYELPYPLNERPIPQHDLRLINGWPCPVCGANLKADGWPAAHQADPDGKVCSFRGPGAP